MGNYFSLKKNDLNSQKDGQINTIVAQAIVVEDEALSEVQAEVKRDMVKVKFVALDPVETGAR